MGEQSQKTHKDVLEQIKALKNEDEIRRFEGANREFFYGLKFTELDLPIILAWNEKWTQATKNPYFMPTGALPRSETKGNTTHPRYSNYRVTRRISGIEWSKTIEKRKAGTESSEIYNIIAILPGGERTTVFNRIGKSQIQYQLPDAITQKIINGKSALRGTIGDLNDEITVVGYWEVVFSNKGDLKDTDDVRLVADGVALQMKRMVPVILSGPHLESADGGKRPVFIQNPKVALKIAASVQYYPYTVVREATEREYLAFKSSGDMKTREERRRQETLLEANA